MTLNADDNIIQRSTVELGFNSTGPVTTLSSWGNLSILSILIIMIMTIIIMIMMMVVITMMKNIREFGSLSPPIQRSVSTSTVSTTAKYVCLNWSCDYCDKNVMKLKRNYQVLDYTQFSLSLERSAKEPHRAVWEAQVPFSKSHLYMAIISRTESCKWFQFFKSLSLSAFPTQFCTE